MFRISRRLDYGLQLLIALAGEPENRPQSTATLAEKLNIPLPFLHQIGHTLMQAGLVKASPGPHGGIRLNRMPETIPLMSVVETLEGPVSMSPCPDCEGECQRIENCSSQYAWNGLQDRVVEYLNGIYLSDLVANARQMESIPAKTLELTRSEYHI